LEDKNFDAIKKEQLLMHLRIGEHLLQRKLIKLPQFMEAIEAQDIQNKLIGEVRIERGYISKEALDEALEWQEKTKELLKELEEETRDQFNFKIEP